MAHQYQLGLTTAGLARRSAHFPHRRLVASPWAAPLVALARLASMWRRLLAWRLGLAGRAAALSGHLVLALGAWGAGLAAGDLQHRGQTHVDQETG